MNRPLACPAPTPLVAALVCAALLPAALLSACGARDNVAFLLYASPTPEEPTAGTWRTWIVADVTAIRPPAPPAPDSDQTQAELAELVALAAARTPSIEADITAWQSGTCKKWNELQRAFIVSRKPPPPKAARGLALVSIAMYDAMVASWDAKFAYMRARPNAFPGGPSVFGTQPDSPSYVSERAAMSGAAATVLEYLFTDPADVATVDANLLAAQNADLNAGIHFRSDVEAGRDLGIVVGNLVVAYAHGDHGDDAQPPYVPVGTPGHWVPTPQNNGSPPVSPPTLPGWGVVKTWSIPTGDFLRPGPAPAFASTEWNAEVQDVLNVNLTLTPERKAIATFWADGGGTVTPPGHWNQIACDYAAAHAVDDCRFARMLALLGVAQHDAFVACWDCKYAYNVSRPITEIRTLPLQSLWLPFINTPSFPSYPSGHSSTSGAASQVLGYLFPVDAFDFSAMATEAKDSRLYGGIHYRFDNDVGLDLGRSIANWVIAIGAGDGSP